METKTRVKQGEKNKQEKEEEIRKKKIFPKLGNTSRKYIPGRRERCWSFFSDKISVASGGSTNIVSEGVGGEAFTLLDL